ncbi:MAG: hypothetical protein U0Q16_08635 [Bryobacteraceae bacterium]
MLVATREASIRGTVSWFRVQSVANAASFAASGVCPGATVAIACTRVPRAPGRGGLRVFFDEAEAMVVNVSRRRIECVAPAAIRGRSKTAISISQRGWWSEPETVPVVEADPALFTADGSGTGLADARNDDGHLNSRVHRARPGSLVILFGTGEGEVTPPVAEGSPAPSEPWELPRPVLPVRVSIAGSACDVLFAGAVPHAFGRFQVQAFVPPAIEAGCHEVRAHVGGYESRPGVSLWVG